jgi:hypothetical protein
MDWGKGQFLPASPRPKAGQWLFNYPTLIPQGNGHLSGFINPDL